MVREFKQQKYWALILGGSSGLGLATAKKLAKHGMNICIVHRNSRSQEESINTEFQEIISENVAFKSYNLDAFKSEKRDLVISELKELIREGSIRTLVHSVAKGNLKPMVDQDEPTLKHDDFELTINAMAISLYDWTKAIFESDLFSKDARIVSFTSEGNSKAWRHYAAVSAAKVALEAITRNIALEYAPYGIRANCIQAGVTDTASLRMIPGSEKIKEYTIRRNPFKRLTQPEDVANMVYLLSKDEAAWINGCVIPVDGGEHIS
ncbi:enoyl-ACP reductase [Psychroserpens sp.]|uniref:enoyl-ACP reductase FabI n=1 Tax=Psychroserpens sp. TaxID=2020870 RepID=UPI001B15EB0A|nr:SDR family oxidoreductase [Psychroserpens sp.]MBO6605291.1 SDR family oxidoreductase [Psychroserpens sp.]MBO6653900.1 SDR family oxidoreductase [Psychroserpens sp.]MBO6682221.1 SDR family oxidoreductase [Psychroserpens sp.]MBO6748665.1 SDR family oxidoreductase [Psychroserpens sp.]MBO6915184.1 SDR family oxidoreductase [Psychroserpens sp.]